MSSSGNVVARGGGGRDGKKTSWLEVVGMPVDEAKAIILKDKPGANIVVQRVGSMMTMDLRFDRVRIFVVKVAGVVTVAETPYVA